MTQEGPRPGVPDHGGEADFLHAVLEERYRIDRILAQGGVSVLYEATDLKCARPVVVKVPRPELIRSPGFASRFETEIRHQIDLDHPGIVKVLDRGSHEGAPFVVIQRLAGGSLAERWKADGSRSEPERVLDWLAPVAETLDYIHARHLVHRDVKPENILFDREGHVFLSDFGIVKALGGSGGHTTVTGVFPGTPGYMAPEQAALDSVTGAADQYALAASVYESLTGCRPHTEEPRHLTELAPRVDLATAEVVMRGLSPEPDERFVSCGAFAEAYGAALWGERDDTEEPGPLFRAPVPWLFYPVALGGVLLVIVLWLLWKR